MPYCTKCYKAKSCCVAIGNCRMAFSCQLRGNDVL